MIRNTIVLGVTFGVILLLGAYFTMYSIPNTLATIEADIKRIETDLQNTPDLANLYNTTAAHLENMKRRWETRNKEVPSKDITGETYGYLNRTMEVSGEVKMDMTYVGPREMGSYGYNLYTLKGEAPFSNLYKFLWHTENGRRLMKVSNLTLRGYESKLKSTSETKVLVLFDMEMEAYYSAIPELNEAPGQQTRSPLPLTSNPFYPLIFREIPAPQPDEIEIERAVLTAVIPGKAFIIDVNNKSHVLQEGDRVYLGYVMRILPNEGKLECMLNKGGVAERFELTIRQGQLLK